MSIEVFAGPAAALPHLPSPQLLLLVAASVVLLACLIGIASIFRGARRGITAEGVADVRDAARALRRLAKPYDPLPYILRARARGRGAVFLGIDHTRRPLSVRLLTLTKNHLEFLGESGVGKSSLAGVLLSQFASAGETVIVFDPKNDRMLPGVLARAGSAWGRYPVHVIDLRPTAGPQLNPFSGCRHDQTEELLQVALELGKTGEGGVDYYRGGDREASAWVAEACPEGAEIRALIDAASEDERVTENENLWRELRQLGRVRAFHTEGGHDLAKLLSKPGVVYIIGSTTRLEVVAAQKLLLQRVLQILDERKDQSRSVCIFLDELKYILSPAALRAAGTIRDRNCHLIFAHQTLGDLDECPGLNPKAVRGAIWGNCGIKIAYKALDASTARELSSIAGEVTTVARSTTRGDGRQSGTARDQAVALMPPHVFTNLPKPEQGEASVGVLVGLGVARYVSTRWLPAGPTPKARVVEPPPMQPMKQSRHASAPGSATPAHRDGAEDSDAPEPNLDDLLR